jgi:hypothetical protein
MYSRKLHQTHNEYVLLISEAAEFERDMRTILLPGKNQLRKITILLTK